MMVVSALLSLPDGLELVEIVETADLLTVHVVATAPVRTCPLCAEVATHVRSNYTRNGQVEGQVTRIKLIKRMMFGRAGFALLRQRVLHAL